MINCLRYIRLNEHQANKCTRVVDDNGLSSFLRTDENGFIRSSSWHSGAIDSDIKIIILGNEVTECRYLKETDRFPSIAEEILINEGLPISILNAGYHGSTLLDCLNVLINKCLYLKPSVVMMMPIINEEDNSSIDHAAEEYEVSTNLELRNSGTDAGIGSKIQTPLEIHEGMLFKLAFQACMISNVAFSFLTIPHKCPEIKFIDDPNQGSRLNRYHYIFRKNYNARKLAAEIGANLIDLELELIGFNAGFNDSWKLNRSGSDRVAKVLARDIKRLIS